MQQVETTIAFSSFGFVRFTLSPYILELRSAFGTAHSLTTQRTNALVTIRLEDDDSKNTFIGFGEVGLPPKKPYCYKADYNDVVVYFQQFVSDIDRQLKHDNDSWKKETPYDPFQTLPECYFAPLRQPRGFEPASESVIRFLFKFLDNSILNSESFSCAASSGIEMALFDLWGKVRQQALYTLLGFPPSKAHSFYTIAMAQTIEPMLESAVFGINYTTLLKLKADENIPKTIDTLRKIDKHLLSVGKSMKGFSVDANASWSPEITMEFLDALLFHQDLKERIMMLEQPFQVEFLKFEGDHKKIEEDEWMNVKKRCDKEGVLIFADESICDSDDVIKMKDYIHGVNIKLEKAGGFRRAVQAIGTAKELSLKVWIGVMVGSCLNSNMAAHLLCTLQCLAGDLDGGLLVTDHSQKFEGGFVWKGDGCIEIVDVNVTFGVGVTPKK